MDNNKKICVIGAGRWGFNHIRTLHQLGSLGGVVELSDENKNKIRNQFPDTKIFSTIEESFDFNFSGYVIATPAITHFNLASKVINFGLPVLIEKPMTLNVDDSIKLVKLSKEKKVSVMVGHLLLFHPAIQKIKNLIEVGKIGQLQYLYSNRLNFGQVRTEENVFWSFAPHDISILQYFTDSYPLEIVSNGGAFLQENIHDTTITTLSYPDNIKAHIYLSWLHPFKEHRIVIIGSEGMITFEDSSDNKPLRFYDKKYVVNNKVPEKKEGKVELIEYNQSSPLTNELKYFISNLDNQDFKISNVQNGLEVVRILEESSKMIF